MTRNLPFWTWFGLLPLSIAAVLVQTGSEEILFRGYIQQALAARFRHPAVWLLGPSALFALGHYLPAEAGDNALVITAWAGLFGVLDGGSDRTGRHLGACDGGAFLQQRHCASAVRLPHQPQWAGALSDPL